MTRMSKYIVVGAALIAAVIGGAGALRYRSHEDTKSSVTGALAQADSYARSETHGAFRMPSSADKVSVTVASSPTVSANGNRSIAITLHIQKGWHVNANPASLPFLIPTAVQAEALGKAVPITVHYPPGRESNIQLDGKAILVYDNDTILVVDFENGKSQRPQSAQNVTVIVTVQSCSDQGICLPPSTLKTVVDANA